MIISIQIDDQKYNIDTAKSIDISIPLNFNGKQPNAYGVEKATSEPCQTDELVGDTRQGGSCNFEQYKIIPHCNGTHTECVGHITNERIAVRDCLQDAFAVASLITVETENASESDETYPTEFDEKDRLITRKIIQGALQLSTFNIQDSKALIIRTLPNDESKLTKGYGDYIPPFFTNEAMNLIVESGIEHLLVDLPSIDRIFDEGKLSNHRIFWNIDAGKFKLNETSRINNTITELIYIPNEIVDDNYLLNLQIAPFQTDVSPSRPLLFNLLL